MILVGHHFQKHLVTVKKHLLQATDIKIIQVLIGVKLLQVRFDKEEAAASHWC